MPSTTRFQNVREVKYDNTLYKEDTSPKDRSSALPSFKHEHITWVREVITKHTLPLLKHENLDHVLDSIPDPAINPAQLTMREIIRITLDEYTININGKSTPSSTTLPKKKKHVKDTRKGKIIQMTHFMDSLPMIDGDKEDTPARPVSSCSSSSSEFSIASSQKEDNDNDNEKGFTTISHDEIIIDNPKPLEENNDTSDEFSIINSTDMDSDSELSFDEYTESTLEKQFLMDVYANLSRAIKLYNNCVQDWKEIHTATATKITSPPKITQLEFFIEFCKKTTSSTGTRKEHQLHIKLPLPLILIHGLKLPFLYKIPYKSRTFKKFCGFPPSKIITPNMKVPSSQHTHNEEIRAADIMFPSFKDTPDIEASLFHSIKNTTLVKLSIKDKDNTFLYRPDTRYADMPHKEDFRDNLTFKTENSNLLCIANPLLLDWLSHD